MSAQTLLINTHAEALAKNSFGVWPLLMLSIVVFGSEPADILLPTWFSSVC